MKKTVLMTLCAVLLFVVFTASAEIDGFELGHMEENIYVNPALGITMEAGDIYNNNGGFLTYTGEQLNDYNEGTAFDDLPALEARMKDGKPVYCLLYANMDRHIIGKTNTVKLAVYLAAEGDENPEITILSQEKEALEKEAEGKGYSLTKAEMSELELAGSMWSRMSVDIANGDRHMQMTYAAIQKGDCVYLLTMSINDDSVEDYFPYFRAQ